MWQPLQIKINIEKFFILIIFSLNNPAFQLASLGSLCYIIAHKYLFQSRQLEKNVPITQPQQYFKFGTEAND